jgi:hypothetical protein
LWKLNTTKIYSTNLEQNRENWPHLYGIE